MVALARQRILDALAHRQPTGVPFSWGFGPTPEMRAALRDHCAAAGLEWDRLQEAVTDVAGVGPRWIGPPKIHREDRSIDAWGICRRTISYGVGIYEEFCDFPLANVTTAAGLDRHPWPDPQHWDASGLREAIGTGSRAKASLLAGGNPFEIYCWLAGLEAALENLLERPALVMDALHRITGIFEARLRSALTVAGDLIDLVFLADDLGTQQSLLLSCEMYRRLIMPSHRRLVATVRALAPQVKILFHSDGAVFDILPELVEAGIDCLEAVQTDAAGMQPERLKERWAGRLAFHGAISVQSLLPHGSPQSVAEACRHLERILGAGGGWIAAPSHAVQAGTPPANVLAMLETILGPERWKMAVHLASPMAKADRPR